MACYADIDALKLTWMVGVLVTTLIDFYIGTAIFTPLS
jgi:hypothetical protein